MFFKVGGIYIERGINELVVFCSLAISLPFAH